MSNDSSNLPDDVYNHIKICCANGDALMEDKKYEEAIAQYNEAWELIPEPKTDWSTSTWVLAAIGDAGFLGGFDVSAREALEYAMICPEGLGNPFLHLRLGQVQFDQGDFDEAADNLMRAYMADGEEIFDSEPPEYLAFLKTRAAL